MESLTQIDNQIEIAKVKRKQIILDALDGRTQRFIADKTDIDETKISKWINGMANLEESEISKIETLLGVDFK